MGNKNRSTRFITEVMQPDVLNIGLQTLKRNDMLNVLRSWKRKFLHTIKTLYLVRYTALLYPCVMRGKFFKGILWVQGNADCIIARFPDIKKYFIIMSTAGFSTKWAPGTQDDIHGLTLNRDVNIFKQEHPQKDYMVIRNADFISEREFYPVKRDKVYDLIFNSNLKTRYKGHEKFLSTLYDIRNNYGRNLHALVVLWTGHPRLSSSRIYPKPFYVFAEKLYRNKDDYALSIRRLYGKAKRDGLNLTFSLPVFRSDKNRIHKLRELYSKAKTYVLLSEDEGVNRTAKEAILCDVPILCLNGNTTGVALCNSKTGKIIDNNQQAISEGLLDLVDSYQRYSPRTWALQESSRIRKCVEIYTKLNEHEKQPGFPSIEMSNKVRMECSDYPNDNYLDLNNWGGGGCKGYLKKDLQSIRRKFKHYV